MSHIAVDLKVIEVLAPMVARAANISEDRALAGLVRLWHRCWSTTSDILTLSQLAGVFGGERIAEVAEVLCADFLERTSEGFRVRGAERYLRLKESRRSGALKTNKLRNERRSRASLSVAPASLPHALTPSTEHRAPNTEHRKESPKPKTAELSGADPRHQPLVDALCREFTEAIGQKMPFDGRSAVGVKALLGTGTDPAVIVGAWRRALRHRGFPTVRTPGELHQHLAHFVGSAPPAASPHVVGTWAAGEQTTMSEGF